MNEELQNALLSIITKVSSGADNAIEFLGDELPDVISQLLLWYGVYNFVLFALSIVFLFVYSYLVFIKCRSAIHAVLDGGAEPLWILSVVPLLFATLPLNLEWLKIWIAPKLWLIEYASTLAR